jgi:hypothetical protein
MKGRRTCARGGTGFSPGRETGAGFTMEETSAGDFAAGKTGSRFGAEEPEYGAAPEGPRLPPERPAERPAAPPVKQGVPAAAPAELPSGDPGPKGLFSPRGNIGWEEYTNERLAAELHRCASFEQDLVFIIMEFRDLDRIDDSFYRQFAEDSVNFFTLRDLIFERGERGISIIYPNIDLETGFAKSEEFHNRILSKYSPVFKSKTDLCIGLSSRSGRLVDAERIVFEAAEALAKALEDPISHIVAFKSDPEKYRDFIASQNKQHP